MLKNGYGFYRISQILNDEYDYPTPSLYYQRKHMERRRVYKHKVQTIWNKDMIRNIIGNEIYTGKLITHKKKTITIRGKAIKLPKEQHFEFENHHEAIISKELFDLAQEIRNKKSENRSTSGTRKRNYYFSGMCKCGECGSGVSGTVITRKVKEKGYECSKYKEYGVNGVRGCVFHEIKEKDILIHLKEFLRMTKEMYIEDIEKIKININNKTNVIDKEKLKNELRILNEEYKVIISQKVRDLTTAIDVTQRSIIENTYSELEKEKMQKISSLNLLIQKNEKDVVKEKVEKIKKATDYFDEIINCEEPNKVTIRLLIDKIYIYQDKTVKFELKPDIIKLINEQK